MSSPQGYKPSKVDWIGDIPASWKLLRGRFLFESKKEINRELQCQNLLSLTLFGVLNKDYEATDGLRPENYNSYQIFQKDDLVFKMIDLENVKTSRVGIVHEEGIMSPVYIRHKPIKNKIDPRFAYWFYYDLYKKEIYNSIGSGVRSSLTSSDLLELELPVPPLEEQKIISNYLDKKTNQIDSLINKIRNKIGLLEEQQTSLISRCVTKGLDSNVEMKESGVEWLGEIPKSWKVTRLKYISSKGVQYGLNIESDSYRENGVRFLRITDIRSDGTIKDDDGVYLNDSDVPDEYYLEDGDVLFSRSGGTVGKSTLIDKCGESMSFAGYLVRFSFDDLSMASFVKWVTESSFYWRWIDLQIIQSTIQNVNGEKYSNFIFAIPNKEEIEKINSYLSKKTKTISQAIKTHEKKIKYLTDYRQSLISSAITGKLRVTE
jgi:type I restriction enzyme S subunit